MGKGTFLAILMATSATTVWASDDDSYTSYESIVNELREDADNVPRSVGPDLNWDEVALHAGMALSTAYVTMTAPNGARGEGLLKGFEGFLGANLFSRKVRGEIAFRNYAPEELSRSMNADLSELEARIVLLPMLADRMVLRMGFGLGMRYMDISTEQGRQASDYSSTEGSTTVLLGFERKVSRAVSLGPDFAYRSTLSATSFDKSSWDAAIRLNATF